MPGPSRRCLAQIAGEPPNRPGRAERADIDRTPGQKRRGRCDHCSGVEEVDAASRPGHRPARLPAVSGTAGRAAWATGPRGTPP